MGMIDPETEKMRQDTGHECMVCPTRVRGLTATVHNALVQWDANGRASIDWPADWPRMRRKMEDMRSALALLQPLIDEHFESLKEWRHGSHNGPQRPGTDSGGSGEQPTDVVPGAE